MWWTGQTCWKTCKQRTTIDNTRRGRGKQRADFGRSHRTVPRQHERRVKTLFVERIEHVFDRYGAYATVWHNLRGESFRCIDPRTRSATWVAIEHIDHNEFAHIVREPPHQWRTNVCDEKQSRVGSQQFE